MSRRLLGPADVLAVAIVLVAGAVAAVVIASRPTGCGRAPSLGCINNVRNLAGLLLVARESDGRLEGRGPNMLLRFVARGVIDPESEERLGILFCPGDSRESVAQAGGTAAFRNLDLTRADLGRFTSYAARDPRANGCAVPRESDQPPVVMLCDDSRDHHDGRGFVVGLSDGTARWWDTVERWGAAGSRIAPGPASSAAEFQCLRAE